MATLPIDAAVLVTHLDYTAWATGLLLEASAGLSDEEAARNLQASHGGVLDTLRHIYYADRVWLARLEGARQQFKDDPEPSLADLRRMWPEVLARFRAFVLAMPAQELASELGYRNLKGEAYSVDRWKILLHVVNHGTLHRGQVMGMLRQLGHKPPGTDLIFYYLAVTGQAPPVLQS